MLLCVSKPRMKIESPVAVLPFSPINMVIPGVLRSVSLNVTAACCLNSSFFTTTMVCGVSTKGFTCLAELAFSAINSGSIASAVTFTSAILPGSFCEDAGWAATGKANNNALAKALRLKVGCFLDWIKLMMDHFPASHCQVSKLGRDKNCRHINENHSYLQIRSIII